MKSVLLQPAYVLHRRAYRETSFLVELFTPEYGRLSVIAKGVRKARSASPGLLQPFTSLLVSWQGKADLMTLTHVEMRHAPTRFAGECLFAGFYLNELLTCLLEKWDAHPGLYAAYERALQGLNQAVLDEQCLRSFEKCLLEELGYGILSQSDRVWQQTILPDKHYRFVPEQGFVLAQAEVGTITFPGAHLLAIAKEQWTNPGVLKDAKRLTRLILTPLLGTRQLHSRKLFE
jgi:DNA repair protein RecO (recombination protein O)